MAFGGGNVIPFPHVGNFIARRILSGSLTTFDFTNIPQHYSHLLLIGMCETDKAAADNDALEIRFNSDAGNNYNTQSNFVLNAAFFGQAVAAASSLHLSQVTGANADANRVGTFQCLIPFYSNKLFHKNMMSANCNLPVNASLVNWLTGTYSGVWRNTSAITKLTIFTLGASNMLINSQFVLYGLR